MSGASFGLVPAMLCLLAVAPPSGHKERMFDGIYEFRNQSKDKLYVDEMTGRAGCGYLVPGGNKATYGPPRSSPAQSVVKWRVVGKEGWKTETLKLDSLLKPQRNAKLV